MHISDFTELAVLSLKLEELKTFVKLIEKVNEKLKERPTIVNSILPGEAQFRYTEILNDLDREVGQLVKSYL